MNIVKISIIASLIVISSCSMSMAICYGDGHSSWCGDVCQTLDEAIEAAYKCKELIKEHGGIEMCSFEIKAINYYKEGDYYYDWLKGRVDFTYTYDMWAGECAGSGSMSTYFERSCTASLELCGDGIDNDCDGEPDNGCNACDNNPKCGKPLVCPPPAASVGSSSDADGSADSAGIEGT